MKILILISGEYGSRVVNNIASQGFAPDIVGIYEFSEDLPEFIDDVEEYIPPNLPQTDLIISVGLSGDINLVIPPIASQTGAQSIIAPIHHPQQIPPGLQTEIKSSLQKSKIVFPKPFCSLTPMGDLYIDEFAQKLGKPQIEIQADKQIKNVKVIRGAPCGSTEYISQKLVGTPVEEAEFESGNKFHNYPCLASMSIDPIIGDTIMHLAGYKTKEAVKRALKFTHKSAVIDKEVCQGGQECEYICLNVCPNVKAGDHTIFINDSKAEIDPGSCGVCEICIKECPYGAIEILEEEMIVKETEQ